MRTHYDVLGVAVDTPPVVVKAAFRALAKEYHPDGTGKESADVEKFIELQNAYAVLSDPETRTAYDTALREAIDAPSSEPSDAPHDEAQFTHSGALAVVGGTEIQRVYARLCLYSETLGASFIDGCRRGKCGADVQAYADALEKKFFREFFGEDGDVQALARLLLLRSRTGAALALNEFMAGGASLRGDALRSLVMRVVEQHCEGEALFAEWLQVKFGLAPPNARSGVDAGSQSPLPPAGRAPAEPVMKRAAHAHASTMRSFAMLCIWALTFYFTLFAAFPLVQ